MGQVLHGSARTTEAVRRAIQHRQARLRMFAKRYGINPKTVGQVEEADGGRRSPTGPREPHSTGLSIEEEAVVVAFRGHALLPAAAGRGDRISKVAAVQPVEGQPRHGLGLPGRPDRGRAVQDPDRQSTAMIRQ